MGHENQEHPEVSVKRAECIYNLGEEVGFLLKARGDSRRGSWTYRMSWDSEASIEEGEIERLPFEISHRPQEPGFLRLSVHDSMNSGEALSGTKTSAMILLFDPSCSLQYFSSSCFPIRERTLLS